METKVNFEQMIENEPFVTMRISFENGVWQTWYISKSVERYGFTREEFINGTTTWNDMLHPDDRVMASKLARDYLDRRLDDFKLHYRILTKAGESINITEISHINRNADGTIYCIDSVLLNLTDAQSKPDLATNHIRQQEVLNDILLSLHDSDHEMSLQIILNRAGTYLNTSRALLFKDSEDHKTCKVIYEWLNKGIISIKDLDYAVTYSTEMPEIYVALQKTGILLVNADEIPENCREEFEKEGLVSSAIFAVYLHGQHYGFVCFDDCVIKRKWDEDAANFLKNIANLISTVLYRMHVEKQLKSNEERIRQLAYTDHLTGLPNRFRCDRDLATSIAMLQEYGGAGYVLFSDLDDFKIVNDCYGHDFGDGVLKSFAEYVSTLFTGKNRVYRFGGDEFVVIIGEGDETLVKNYLDRLIARAKKPWPALGKEFYCSLSIGVVKFTGSGDTPQSLIKKADIAMYQAKKSGKNNYVEYTEGLDCDSIRRTEREALLREAMQNDFQGCVLHYQPYSDAKTRKVLGAEALLRLRGPDGTLYFPDQFLSLADYLGLMIPLGDFVMAKAAEQCKIINSMKGMANFSVTINMSPKQLKQKNVIDKTETILRNSGVNFANIIISINEITALGETEKMLQVGAELRKLGIRMALNEFGSGSSSFINMRALPVDVIKVSSKYVENIEDEFTGAFINLISKLGHFTNKVICMNDVETETQYALCRKFGIDWVQGFLFHKPNDVAALIRVLSSSITRVFTAERWCAPPSFSPRHSDVTLKNRGRWLFFRSPRCGSASGRTSLYRRFHC